MKHRIGLMVVAVSIVLPTSASDAASTAQALKLGFLTVPTAKLPRGCRLRPAPLVMYPGVRENPWDGTRLPTLSSIRDVVDGPPSAHETLTGPALFEKRMANLLEGYRAQYVAATGMTIDVYALRYDDPKLTGAAVATQLGGSSRTVFVIGSTAVAVLPRSGNTCIEAVNAHLRALEPKH